MTHRTRIWLRILAGILLVLVLAGYMGHIHPLGDTLAVFRVYLAGALAVVGGLQLAAGVRGQGIANGGLGLAVIASLGLFPFGRQIPPSEGQTVVHHYQKNMLYHNDDPSGILADILSQDPDVVTLQEAVGRSGVILRTLLDAYETGLTCDSPGADGLAIFAVWTAVPGTAFCGEQVAGVQVEGPDGPVWIIAIHLRWVYPYQNAKQAGRIETLLRDLEGPKIVAGDFNVVPWADSVKGIAEAAQVQRVGRALVTFARLGVLRVQIDHVFATGGAGVTARRPRLGSDHWGIWAEYTMDAS